MNEWRGMEKRALGKGLSALIPESVRVEETSSKSKEENVQTILPVSKIKNNSLQPRGHYDADKLEDLKQSISEKGILQPILVRQKDGEYEVVAGERRLRASRELGFKEIPVVIKEIDDKEALVIALVENIQREDLTPLEEAEAYKNLIEDFQYTQEQVAHAVGKNRSTIANTLRLLVLPDNIKKGISEGVISAGHARAILSLQTEQEQQALFERILKTGLSVRESESVATTSKVALSTKTKNKIKKNIDIVTLEESLQNALGTKVEIISRKKRGKVVIEYYTLDDLDRIISIIKK